MRGTAGRLVAAALALLGLGTCRLGGRSLESSLLGPGTHDYVVSAITIDPVTSTVGAGFNFDGLYSLASDPSGCGVTLGDVECRISTLTCERVGQTMEA